MTLTTFLRTSTSPFRCWPPVLPRPAPPPPSDAAFEGTGGRGQGRGHVPLVVTSRGVHCDAMHQRRRRVLARVTAPRSRSMCRRTPTDEDIPARARRFNKNLAHVDRNPHFLRVQIGSDTYARGRERNFERIVSGIYICIDLQFRNYSLHLSFVRFSLNSA